MAGIINRTARQFNLKCIGANKNRTIVRVAPGFNVVDDEHWKQFVNGKKVDPYVAELKKAGDIDFGPTVDDLELEKAPDTKAKSKSEPLTKLKVQLEKAEKEAQIEKQSSDKAKSEAETAKAKEREALARAEKAELELKELKKKNADKK